MPGSVYGVVTFVALAAAFLVVTNQAFGWEPVPSTSRVQGTAMLLFYCATGYYAYRVGTHRDVGYLEALRRGMIDVGRAIKGLVMR